MHEGGPVADDWQRVGRAIEQRINELSLTVAEIDRLGVSDKTLKGYLGGQPIVRKDKRRKLCGALRWTPRSIDLILDGGEPEELPAPDPEIIERLSRLEARFDRLEDRLRGDPR
jgi:hypothetical protein